MSSGYAAVSLNGADLLTTPNVSFPTLTPSTVGNSISFGTGDTNPVLIRWDLFGANTLNPGSATEIISLDANVTRTSSDFDFSVGLWDGTHYLAVMPIADGSRAFGLQNSTSDGMHNIESPYDYLETPDIGIGQSVDLSVDWTLGAGSSSVTLGILGVSNTWVTTNAFDRTSNISLLFSKQTSGEMFQLNTLTLDAIPEPATMGLMVFLSLGAVFIRRRFCA